MAHTAKRNSKSEPTGREAAINSEETNLVYPVSLGAGALIVVAVAMFALTDDDSPKVQRLAIVLQGVESFLADSGWTLLGLSVALLAAAFTALSIIGYRGHTESSPIKLDTIRATIHGFIVCSVALATPVAMGYFLAPTSLGHSISPTMDPGSGSERLTASISDVQQDIKLMVQGLSSFAIIAIASQLGQTVTVWFRTDLEVHQAERKLLVRRIAMRRLLIQRMSQKTQGAGLGFAIFRCGITGLLVVFLSYALAIGVTFADYGQVNLRTAALVAFISTWIVSVGGTGSVNFWNTMYRGPAIIERNSEPTEAWGRWKTSLILWGAGILIAASPAVAGGMILIVEASQSFPAKIGILLVSFGPSFVMIFWPFRWGWATVAACSAVKGLLELKTTDELRLKKLVKIKATEKPQKSKCSLWRWAKSRDMGN